MIQSKKSLPKRAKFDPILNQSFVLQFKEVEKEENLESLMVKLNIQDYTSPKKHDQNDEARVVVDCNDVVIEIERQQESHIKIRLIRNINKNCWFCKLKIKSKRYFESYVLI